MTNPQIIVIIITSTGRTDTWLPPIVALGKAASLREAAFPIDYLITRVNRAMMNRQNTKMSCHVTISVPLPFDDSIRIGGNRHYRVGNATYNIPHETKNVNP